MKGFSNESVYTGKREEIRIYIYTHTRDSLHPSLFAKYARDQEESKRKKGKEREDDLLDRNSIKIVRLSDQENDTISDDEKCLFSLDHASFAQVYSEATGESTDLISNKLVDAALHRIDHCCLKLSR